MGWTGGNTVFGPVARKARELGLTDEQVTELLTTLIRELQDRDWDTEDESLRDFQADPAIVAAFRACKVVIKCGAEGEYGPDSDWPGLKRWCDLERGHKGEEHEDDAGKFAAASQPS